jgi:hypothetical protein
MIRRPILFFSTEKPTPQRVFDVVIENDKIDLEIKIEKKKLIKIPWEEVVSQVKAAKAAYK